MPIIEFTIHVEDAADVAALFDRIQVWRATTQNGTFSDITNNAETPAILDGSVEGPWTLSGLTLTVIRNLADPVDITFTGSDPLLLQDVIEQINAVMPGFASEVPTDTGKIRLTSAITGTQSTVQAMGTARTVLGFSSSKTNGKAARLLLSENTDDYLFRDFDGDNSLWYKTRYFSTVTGAVSDFSVPRQSGAGAGLPGSVKVVGSISLATLDGAPLVGRRVIFVPTGPQVVPDGSGNNFGILPSVDRIVITTDGNGQASITLVKGQRLKVFLEGTTFQREFIVPDTDFDILTVASAQPDPLSVVNTPPFPIRVS